MKKVYLDEINVTARLYNRDLKSMVLSDFSRPMYCGRFLAIKGIIEGDDEMDPEDAATWASWLDKAATSVVRGEELIIEGKSI